MNGLKIFVSHSTEYKELAKSLKLSLQALEVGKTQLLDIKISEEMAGATNWRKWIDENVRTADVFLLLYPHANMGMGWCNYELGRFYEEQRHVVCIKNTDIPKPPPAFEPYQAYDANESGFAKFIHELFVAGTFTDGRPLNSDIGNVTSEFYKTCD
jgi:TIR domain-containing protein